MEKVKEIKPKIGFIGSDRQNIIGDLNFAVRNRFDYYEIQGLGENFDLRPEIIKKVKKISNDNNISLNLHAFHLPISSLIPEISEPALKFAKNEIVLANKVGAKQITIHSGHKDKPESETAVAKNFGVLIKNFKEIVKFGKKYGIKIGLENSWTSERLCRKAEDLLRVVNSVKGLGIVFDAGHANAAGLDPLEYFKKVKNRVINIHISDNDGKFDQHAVIGEGNINYKALLGKIKNSGYYGPFILEVFPYKNVLRCREKFLNIWNQI